MQIEYVIGALVLDQQVVKIRSLDTEGNMVDVNRSNINGISEQTLHELRMFPLVPHGDTWAIKEEIETGHFAYDGNGDEELVESVRKHLHDEQRQMEEDSKKSVYQVVATVRLDGEHVKMAGLIIAEDEEQARRTAKAYCMDRYHVAMFEVNTEDITLTDIQVREAIVSLSKSGYKELQKTNGL